ncbi:MAG: glutamate synthase central domain-containing protein, partial [Verrucomicrobiota bacterium]
AHNGEINTLRGNRNWFASRESDFDHELWGEDVKLLTRIIDQFGSDSASLDSALEVLVLSGRSVPHAMAMLIPPAWRIDPTTTDEEKAFYQYNRCFTEPWDGPAAIVFSDGRTVAASLDRNGLRPARYKLTNDGIFTVGSEVGVVEIDDATVIKKGRLAPGEMIAVDTETGQVQLNDSLKKDLGAKHPYREWLDAHRLSLSDKVPSEPTAPAEAPDPLTLSQRQITFGYNKEELDMAIAPMIENGMETTYSMGDDTPLSVLSLQPHLLYTYFKQLFAQVTNPPIDPIRERLVMTLNVTLGWERNLLKDVAENAKVVHLNTPFLFEHELEALKNLENFPSRIIDTTWAVAEGPAGLQKAVKRIREEALKAIEDGVQIVILSDRAASADRVPVPALLATGATHHFLNRAHLRMRASLVIDSGEARDTHQMACLFGFGASAICPYLAFDTIGSLMANDPKKKFESLSYEQGLLNYRAALEKGLLKIMSKMGISVLSSYQGAQIFEAIGLSNDLVDDCFTGTPSQLDGVSYAEIAEDSLKRHSEAYVSGGEDGSPLKLIDPGYYRFRRDKEVHSVSPGVIKNFHTFVRENDAAAYDNYVAEILKNRPVSLHDLFDMVPASSGPIPLDQVESIEKIRVRFTTAAMSCGAISPEAHETLAIAMNRIGGKSNSGEGGEDQKRFKPYPNGDWANSRIKQVASGRFGVSAEYLASASEIEIKMAQGAKPGEGGQLPAHKVSGIIARLRNTQPGVQLISPPPHHDIYSI